MRILVGLDGSPQALGGLEFVGRLELSPHDEVILAAFAEVPISPAAGLAVPSASVGWYDELRGTVLEEARRIVAEAAAQYGARGGVETIAREGHPVRGLEALARERSVDLLVVGPHGRSRLESVLFGSVSGALLHTMPTTILVARPIRAGLSTALLAVDGSSSSHAAARFLATLPLPRDTRVVATSVLRTRNPAYGQPWPDEVQARIDSEERTDAEHIVDEAVRAIRDAGRAATGEVRTGPPKEGILAATEDHQADVVVLGARGLGGLESLVVGSVSRAVSEAAACSVLVVHAAR